MPPFLFPLKAGNSVQILSRILVLCEFKGDIYWEMQWGLFLDQCLDEGCVGFLLASWSFEP